MKKQLVFNRPVWIFLLFLVGSFLFVDLNFRYWFHFMEQFMLFQTTSVYWKELVAQLGGWNEYIAEYPRHFPLLPVRQSLSLPCLV